MSATSATSATFAALGDPVRRRILELLAAGERPVAQIHEQLRHRSALSQPAVSQHLKVLREAGLVRARAEGTRRYYAIDAHGVAAAQGWLAGLVDPLAAFEQPLDALATEVARGQRASARAQVAPVPESSRRSAV